MEPLEKSLGGRVGVLNAKYTERRVGHRLSRQEGDTTPCPAHVRAYAYNMRRVKRLENW